MEVILEGYDVYSDVENDSYSEESYSDNPCGTDYDCDSGCHSYCNCNCNCDQN